MNLDSLVSAAVLVTLGALAGAASAQSDLSAPEDGGARYLVVSGVETSLNMRAEPSTSAAVLGQVAPGAMLVNLGCAPAADRVWCDVQPVGGGARGFAAGDFLAAATAPDGSVPRGPDLSASRAGQGDFDTTGILPCAIGEGATTMSCAFGVSRSGGGDATFVIARPNDEPRAVFFTLGRAMGTDSSEADPASFDFEATEENGVFRVRIGAERYSIPAALAFDF